MNFLVYKIIGSVDRSSDEWGNFKIMKRNHLRKDGSWTIPRSQLWSKSSNPQVGRAKSSLWGEVSSTYPAPVWPPLRAKFQNLDPFCVKSKKLRPDRLEPETSCNTGRSVNFGFVFCSLKKCVAFCLNGFDSNFGRKHAWRFKTPNRLA